MEGLGEAARALRQLESSGNYGALGPVVKKGRYKGDRAYGGYQVMGKNIPSWTKQALGYSMTPQQFLKDRKAQDKVFAYKFGGYVKSTGSLRDAASMWHSGSTLARAKARGATDGYMKTVDYVNKFSKFYSGKAPTNDGYSTEVSSFSNPEPGPVENAMANELARLRAADDNFQSKRRFGGAKLTRPKYGSKLRQAFRGSETPMDQGVIQSKVQRINYGV